MIRSNPNIIKIVSVLALISFFVLIIFLKKGDIVEEKVAIEPKNIENSNLLNGKINAYEISFQNISSVDFTPDNKYLVFKALTAGNPAITGTFLYSFDNDSIQNLDSSLLESPKDNRYIMLSKNNKVVIHFLGAEQKDDLEIDTPSTIDSSTLSPDGKIFIFNTKNGFYSYSIVEKTLTEISNKEGDQATDWYAGNVRLIGSKIQLDEFGNEEDFFGLWNIVDKTFQPLSLGFDQEKIKDIKYIVTDKIVYFTTHKENKRFAYLFDISNEKLVPVGELTGSDRTVDISKELGLLAIVGVKYTENQNVASVYRNLGEISRTPLSLGFDRNQIKIINDHKIIYIRKLNDVQNNLTNKPELVLFDTALRTEKILKQFDEGDVFITISKDRQKYIAVNKGQFYYDVIK